jgi:predicted DNA-binding protein
MYGMKKTTVYLPEDLKSALGRVAAQKGRSEAELIREA